jgi:hypothetical protein
MIKKEVCLDYFKQMLINWNCLNRQPVGNTIELYSLDDWAKKYILEFLQDFKYSDEGKYTTFLFMGNYIKIWK